MANVIQIKRGVKSSLPTLSSGELGWVTDEKELYIGDGAVNHLVSGTTTSAISQDVTYTIPTDYATLQEAFNDLSQYKIKHGATVTLNIATGHALTTGLKLVGGNYGQFRITSTDATVYLSSSITWVDNSPSGPSVPGSQEILFNFDNCIAPRFEILVDMDGAGQHGYDVINGARGFVASGCGVKNCGWHNLMMSSNAHLVCNYGVWTGAGLTGMYIQVNSDCVANYADASDPSGVDGKCVHCSRNSRLYFNYGKANNSNSHGIDVRRSRAQLEYCEVKNAASVGIRAEYASNVTAYGADASGATLYGVMASRGSVVDASYVDASTAGTYGFVVSRGGIISAYDSTGTKSQTKNELTGDGIIYDA